MDHLTSVAEKARQIISETGLKCTQEAFYAGLLHDIGKLNPFYQEVFHASNAQRKAVQKMALAKYERIHSPLSAWAAIKLLDGTKLDEWSRNLVTSAIFCHHSNLRNALPRVEGNDKLRASQDGMAVYLKTFRKEVDEKKEFSNLDWDYCMSRFKKPISFQFEISSNINPISDFLKSSCVFSALIQADRGNFSDWSIPEFKVSFDTIKLIKVDSNLGQLRSEFQNHAIATHDVSEDVSVLEAPTGIGKTKVFLDLVPRYVKKNNLRRVFYFSPLLALTEDFEKKVNYAINEGKDDVLIYNHLFSGSLEQKTSESGMPENLHWDFEAEAFNKEFVITTTQRLLMILYSNKTSDKMKLLSLRNSLLIIDEIQTVPKFALPNLIKLFQEIARNLNSKILLVSATIPHELRNLKRTLVQKELHKDYLRQTHKQISFEEPLEIPSEISGRTLFMSNTRKKNLHMYNSIINNEHDNVIYMSSGITKKSRIEKLEDLHSKECKECIVVSTQVLEAGVDVSFSKIYREVAPLDNIIQVMGRLNREGEIKNATIVVFKSEKDDHTPYSELEWLESLKIIKDVKTSEELYEKLATYYKIISDRNNYNKSLEVELDGYIRRLDFAEIWNFAKKHLLPDEHQESVFIPEDEVQLNEIKSLFMNQNRNRKREVRKFSQITAQLPGSPDKLGISHLFDEELYEMGVLLPKWQNLNEIYDKNVGLDKWTEK